MSLKVRLPPEVRLRSPSALTSLSKVMSPPVLLTVILPAVLVSGLSAFREKSPPKRNCISPVVVTWAERVMAPAGSFITMAPAFTAAPTVRSPGKVMVKLPVILIVPLISMLLSATRIRLPPNPPSVTAAATVMSPSSLTAFPVALIADPSVVMVTVPPAPRLFSAAFTEATVTWELMTVGVNMLLTGKAVTPGSAMVTLSGSSNQIPPLPEAEEVKTDPMACRFTREEVSIKPPLPPSAPPLAKRSP